MATLAELKSQLGINTLELTFLKDENGERQIDPKTQQPTLWAKHWDNTNRQALLVHKDTFDKIKADPEMSGLGLKSSDKTGEKGAYKMHILITYTAPDLGTL